MDDLAPIIESARQPAVSAMERLRQRDQVANRYPVIIDREWAKERLEVVEAITRAKRTGGNASDLEARLAELEERRGEAVLEFTFRHCSPVRYETLLHEHRPTAEQREEAKGQPANLQPRWAPSFRPALVEEVLIEPKFSREEIGELFGEGAEQSILSPAEAMELFSAAMAASNIVARFETAEP